MKNILIALLALALICCKENSKSEFSLIGTTDGIKDGTILYLSNTLEDRLIDSTSIENNSFSF